MRDFLPLLMAFITRHERYEVRPGVNFEWNKNLWTHNIFRAYEVVFGRRFGIRAESSVYRDSETGKVVVAVHSFEAAIAYAETWMRGMVPRRLPYRIWVPVLQTPQGFPVFASPYIFAIAIDTQNDGGTSSSVSLTWSHTVTGSDTFVHVGYLGDTGADRVTSVTYNSVAATQLATSIKIANTRYTGQWGVANTASGAHNVVVSFSSGSVWCGSASYSGVSHSTPPDSTNSGGATTTALTVSTTVVAGNSWLIGVGGGSVSGPLTAGTGTTQRQTIDGQSTLFDSNGAVAAGSRSLQETGSSQGMDLIVSSIAPFSAASGPANLKSYNTNLKANIKSIDTNLIANVKSFDTNA